MIFLDHSLLVIIS